MRKIRIAILLSGLIPFVAHANGYTVQIGTYRNPDRDLIEDQVADIGEINTATTTSGMIEYLVGPFATDGEAQGALQRLQAAGFGDAFVRRTADSREHAQAHGQRFPQEEESELLSSLSEEERRTVVYLDGRLHRKIGDRFIPLDSAPDEGGAR